MADRIVGFGKINGCKSGLARRGVNFEYLDGGLVREDLTKDLDFSKEGRDENLRRIGFVANLLCRNNIPVVASFITLYCAQRAFLRKKVGGFIEVYIDAPLAVCEKRDPKGLYKKARAGEIRKFTGISDPYEKPLRPGIYVRTDELRPEECVEEILDYLVREGYLD